MQSGVADATITSELLLRDTTLSHNSADKSPQFGGLGASDLSLLSN